MKEPTLRKTLLPVLGLEILTTRVQKREVLGGIASPMTNERSNDELMQAIPSPLRCAMGKGCSRYSFDQPANEMTRSYRQPNSTNSRVC